MKSEEITKSENKKSKSDTEKSKSLKILIHYLVILSISFSFTIMIFQIQIESSTKCKSEEVEKIVESFLLKNELIRKIDQSNHERKFGYLHENQENDSPRKRVKKNILEEDKEPQVAEFFHPNLKSELEKNDTEIMKKTGLKGAAPGGDSWVWMTAYSRIPFEAIEGFCKKTREYCPPGPTGLPGEPGQRGSKGEKGPQGPKGESINGPQGPQGPRGYRGIKGLDGKDGLNGKDGTPGEPGIDGVSGRGGIDGVNGRDGEKGEKGDAGFRGDRGTDGIPGTPGNKGEKGEKGLAGPQGRRGIPGINGENGAPATCVYARGSDTTITDGSDLFLPPQIPVASTASRKKKPIVVLENDNLRLQCSATGIPLPTVVWTREDGNIIDGGTWKDHSKVGHSFNITKINRKHMGTYVCTADNAISPAAKYTFMVEVHFKPVVKINHQRDQNVSVNHASSVTFYCLSEAFPEPVIYWEKGSDEQFKSIIQNDSSKYKIESNTMSMYQFNSSLTINNIDGSDYDDYYCVSKNILGTQKIKFSLLKYGYGFRPKDGDKPLQMGETPPVQGYEDLCPPPEPCPFCPTPKDMKCKDTSLSLNDLTGGRDLEVKFILGTNYSDMGNRTQDCELSMIGKPVLNHFVDIKQGAWMRDPVTRENITVEKIWLTKESEPNNLYEYKNRLDYQRSISSRISPFKLACSAQGNAHIIYNGYFYYYCDDQTKLIRYDLRSEKAAASFVMENINKTHHLYSTKYNVIDFNADDNGIWIIHSALNSNNTIVSKINETTLEPLITFEISIQHHKIGEMFIICGVLYAVDSTVARNTKIRFALDLYSGKLLDKDLDFNNPLNGTSSIGYNHNTKELYTWNSGNQLSYPIKINAMGTNATADDSIENYIAKAVGHSRTKFHGKKETTDEPTTTAAPAT